MISQKKLFIGFMDTYIMRRCKSNSRYKNQTNQRRYGRKEIEPEALRYSEGKRRQARLYKGRPKGENYLL